MTNYDSHDSYSAPYARLGQGHAPGAVRGPHHNARGTRSASRSGTAAASGPHSISKDHAQAQGRGQAGLHLGKSIAGSPKDPQTGNAAAAAALSFFANTLDTIIPCIGHGM
ncbi:hypothetical protein CORC01_06136 [Colletotrichum orchidophilum]|uniref:Uncharacterized protein n=1 Tax=Colletotrichum orchidophilum TaxID=1209926 RepID=A0A1G4BAZ8_9PEZI|nr:uncharacterized protein CORC01_06136 [Colletotrichum orchidophilum]OHE98515.1 hypothetical protein CORC01_06136 [Colletotrichum orchidophilum]